MEECLLNENEKNLAEVFFSCYNICRDCKVKPCRRNKNCVNPSHLYISKINIDKLEEYLYEQSDCLIWLGVLTNNIPWYNTCNLRKLVYTKNGQILPYHAVEMQCLERRCLNFDHMFLKRKNQKKCSKKIADLIRADYNEGTTLEVLSRVHGVSKQNVSLIVRNKIWR